MIHSRTIEASVHVSRSISGASIKGTGPYEGESFPISRQISLTMDEKGAVTFEISRQCVGQPEESERWAINLHDVQAMIGALEEFREECRTVEKMKQEARTNGWTALMKAKEKEA